jgi:hypothetical protein
VQEACRYSNLKAYAVFIDFKKAFDSPPKGDIVGVLGLGRVPSRSIAGYKSHTSGPKGENHRYKHCL